MDRRVLTVLGASLLLALVVASIFYQMTARASGPRKAEQSETKDVVVAARPLGVGTNIKAQDIKKITVPIAAFQKGAFSNPAEVLDRPVTSPILQDEPILEGRLAARGSGVGLAPIIPVGMRAVSVRVNDVSAVAGFVLPGMRVDVLVTGRPPGAAAGTVTTTCLQNMVVLSVGTSIQADARGSAMQAPTVTLLASPDQSETLTLANSEGHVQLVLRNASDQTIEKTRGTEESDLFGNRSRRPAEEAPRPRPRPVAVAAAPVLPPPPPPPDQVVVIRGTQKSVETVGTGHGAGLGR